MNDRRPICVQCRRRMRCHKNDFWFVEGNPPHEIRAADEYQCDVCGAQVLSGFALEPIAIAHQETFARAMKVLGEEPFTVVEE